MGYIKHHAIIVTGWNSEEITRVWRLADDMGMRPTMPVTSGSNGYVSFLIPPDGSKEGWEHSEIGDRARSSLLLRLTRRHAVGIDWVEVVYSPNDGVAFINDTSYDNDRSW